MARKRTGVALGNYLNAEASSPYYPQALKSSFYESGIPSGADKIRFYIQTVDEDGEAVIYSYGGQSFLGLVLLINPSSVNDNYSKIISRTQTMSGWVEEHWGEELDTISFSGNSAAFIWGGPASAFPKGPLKMTSEEARNMFNSYMNIPDLGTNEPLWLGDHSGLTVKRRRNTLSYEELKRIVHLMNGNGLNYDIYGIVKSRKYIQLSYDQGSYKGYFESLDITESADSPFKFTYTFTFKSEETIKQYLG